MSKGQTFNLDDWKSEPDLRTWFMIDVASSYIIMIKMIDWCEKNITSDFWYGSRTLWFKKESDAVLFKLRWG